MSRQRSVSASRVISADPQMIFDVVADPSMHPVIDGSGSVRSTRDDAPVRLALRSEFGMKMQLGAPYRITNVVVEFEEGRLLAWRHLHGHRWRYELEPVEGGTRVTHTFDWTRARSKLTLRLGRFPQRNLIAMRTTLERLDQLVTDGKVGDRDAS